MTKKAAREGGSGVSFRCYCCGTPVTGQIALVTMSPEAVDRVFIMEPDHVERLDDATTRSLLVAALSGEQ